MSEVLTPDICVIGAGSAGLTVAAAAASFGVSVVLVERGKMGGDCLNTGCVPSKALIAAANRAQAVRDAGRFGISAGEPRTNFAAVMAHVRASIAAIEPNDSAERFTGLGVKVLSGVARFADARTVQVGETRDPRPPLRHRDRLAPGDPADPQPDRRSLSHQRDDLRAEAAARPSDRHRRRADRHRDGAGLPPPRLRGDGA